MMQTLGCDSLAIFIQISLVCLGKTANESYLPFAVPYLGSLRQFHQLTSQLGLGCLKFNTDLTRN